MATGDDEAAAAATGGMTGTDKGAIAARLATSLVETIERLLARPLAPGLYVVATPIGHLGDVTLRALATLAGADMIYCEDTRVSRKLLAAYAIRRPLKAYHEHNAASVRPRILARLAAGARIALVSDAGTPLISDPGYKLAREAQAAGHPVVSIPGPSAVMAALASAGLPTDRFLFEGFLAPKRAGRRAQLLALADVPATLVFFETAPRLAASLEDMSDILGPREAVVARELTKIHEEARRGPLDDLARWSGQTTHKGEIVVLVGPPPKRGAVEDREIVAALGRLIAENGLSLRDAVREVTETLDVPRRRVYELGLALAGRQAKAP